MFRLAATLSFSIMLLACPSEINPDGDTPGHGDGPTKRKAGEPCDASTLCELGLVCEEKFVLL